MKKIIYILLLTVFFVSCNLKSNNNTIPLFDLKTLVQQDIDSLEKNNCGCIKNIIAVDNKEQKLQDTINWKKEMQLLLSCDINKPKWIEHFKVDSLKNKIIYTAQNNKIPIKKLTVYYNNNEVVQVEIKKQQQSLLLKNITYINYIPKHGFEIKQEQYLPLNKPFIFIVDEQYKCN